MKTKKFYETDYIPFSGKTNPMDVDLMNPTNIYGFLQDNVYKQDEYCKKSAMLLYNHARGIPSRLIVCGPSGNGKTLVAEQIKKLWPKTIIVNAATLTKEGWVGSNKVSSFLDMVDSAEPDYIVVFDEFDKIVQPHHSSSGEDASAYIQSEFLKLLEGEQVKVVKREMGKEIVSIIDTSKMSFIFCGSFAVKANDIAKKNSTKAIGFTGADYVEKPYSKELTINDIIDYGLIPEIASRVSDVVNVKPLTLKDYEYLLTDHPASPVKKIEEDYQVKLHITKKKLRAIAKEAYESNLGVRYANSKLRRLVDLQIFDSFERSNSEITFIDLK